MIIKEGSSPSLFHKGEDMKEIITVAVLKDKEGSQMVIKYNPNKSELYYNSPEKNGTKQDVYNLSVLMEDLENIIKGTTFTVSRKLISKKLIKEDYFCIACGSLDPEHDIGECCADAMGYGEIRKDNQEHTICGVKDEYGSL